MHYIPQSTDQYSYPQVKSALEDALDSTHQIDGVLDRLAQLFPDGVPGRYTMGDIYSGLRHALISGRTRDEIMANIREANISPRHINAYDPERPGREENPDQPGMTKLYSEAQFKKTMEDLGLTDRSVAGALAELNKQLPYSSVMSRALARDLGVEREEQFPGHYEGQPVNTFAEEPTDTGSVGPAVTPDISDFASALLGSGLNRASTNEIINNAIDHAKERARWTHAFVEGVTIPDFGKEVKLELGTGGCRQGRLTDYIVVKSDCPDPIHAAGHPERYFVVIDGKLIQVKMSDVIWIDHNSKE